MKPKVKKARKKAAIKRGKPRRGGAPSAVELARWNGLGYLTPAQAAERAKVARTTVYGWVERGALQAAMEGDARAKVSVVRKGALVWLLTAAVDALKPQDAEAAIAEAARAGG